MVGAPLARRPTLEGLRPGGCIMDRMSGIFVRACGPVEDRDALHTMVSVLGYGLEWRRDGCGELAAYRGGYRISSIAATGDVWEWLCSLRRLDTVWP